jgi:hypothetical protein
LQTILSLLYLGGFLAVLLLGWWLPALVFYVGGAVLLVRRKRWPAAAIAWSAAFLASLCYTLYDGVYLKGRFEHHSATFADVVSYAPPPAEPRTILISRDTPNTLTGNGQECSFVCASLLFGGRFDRVVIAFKNPFLFDYDTARRDQARRQYRGPDHYKVYTLLQQAGCKSFSGADIAGSLQAWALFGRCIVETREPVLQGPRFEYLLDEDAPGNPPWPVAVRHIRLVDQNGTRDIARAESAATIFTLPFPIPGWFLDDLHGTSLRGQPRFMSINRRYGPSIRPRDFLARVFDQPLNGPVPMPRFEDRPASDRVALARQILGQGPADARRRLITEELARLVPLDAAHRTLILDYVRAFEFRNEGHFQMIPYIAWLAARDPELGPPIAAIYVERAFTGPNNRKFARNLSFLTPELLAPHAARLLAPYAGPPVQTNDSDLWRTDLNFGIGNAGPAAVDILIRELEGESRDGKRAPNAAAALCRAGDKRAIEPLLRKMEGYRPGMNVPYPMSYAYALARLGRGAEAQQKVAPIRTQVTPEKQCLDEIVAKYPDGGAPDSICLIEGPYQQPGAEWQFSEAALKCLAPRTPAVTE